jgi:hypothetical protein
VPAGGLSPDHTRWVRSPDNYFLPKGVLRKVFRGKFVDALEQAFQNGQLNFHPDLKLLANPKTFAAWRRALYRQNWVVYLKPPFGGPEYVLQYLGRYTHRVAISNHRLVSFADGQVTFRWRDSADGNKQKLLPLSVNEFLSRFLLHILPQGFVRIRNFGFLANRLRTTLLPLCFQLLGATPEPLTEEHTPLSKKLLIFMAAPSVEDQGRLSSGSRLPKSNFVPHRWSPPRHEKTLSNSKTPYASAHSVPFCLAPKRTPSCNFLNDRLCDISPPWPISERTVS